MQKNLVLAVVLSSLVYIGWYSFMEKKLQPQKNQAAQQQAAATATPAPAAGSAASAAQAPAALPVSAELKKETISIKAAKPSTYSTPARGDEKRGLPGLAARSSSSPTRRSASSPLPGARSNQRQDRWSSRPARAQVYNEEVHLL